MNNFQIFQLFALGFACFSVGFSLCHVIYQPRLNSQQALINELNKFIQLLEERLNPLIGRRKTVKERVDEEMEKLKQTKPN